MKVRRKNQQRGAQRGFTMIEVLIAVVVLIIGIAGVIGLQVSSTRLTSHSRHATEATQIGVAKVEELRTSTLLNLVSSGTPLKVNAQGLEDPNGFYDLSWLIRQETVNNVYNIHVTVEWAEQGNTSDIRSVSFATQVVY